MRRVPEPVQNTGNSNYGCSDVKIQPPVQKPRPQPQSAEAIADRLQEQDFLRHERQLTLMAVALRLGPPVGVFKVGAAVALALAAVLWE